MNQNCFHCVPILGGAMCIGFISLAVYGVVFSFTLPYVLETDSIFKNNMDSMINYVMVKFVSLDDRGKIHKTINKYMPTTVMIFIIFTGFQCIVNLMMITGVAWRKRILMIPYLITNWIKTLLKTILGISVIILTYSTFGYEMTVFMITGVVTTVIASIYFQLIVIKWAYMKLGTKESIGDPANYEAI